MTPESHPYPPSARRVLNQIIVLLFTPEAPHLRPVALEGFGALIAKFEDASMSDVTSVKSLLSTVVGELEKVETRIELRNMEESQRQYEAMVKDDKERRRALLPILEEERRLEGAKMLRGWLVQDQEVILRKMKSKELLKLPEFLEAGGTDKRTVRTAMTTDRMFCITGPDGQDYYPAFFADSNDYIRDCLGKVCRALKDIPAYAKYQFLTTNNTLIGGQPLDALHHARVNEVLDATKYLLQSD